MLDYAGLRRFIGDLRVNGFSIGVVEEQRVVELLVRLQASGAMPRRAADLCTLLGPALCGTAEQQHRFRSRFEAHFGSRDTSKAALKPEPVPRRERPGDGKPSPHPSPLKAWRALPRRERRQIARRASITFVFVMLAWGSATALFHMGLIQFRPSIQEQLQQQAEFERKAHQEASRVAATVKTIADQMLAGPRAAWDEVQFLGPFTLFTITAPFLLAGLWITAPGRRRVAHVSRREVKVRPNFVELLLRTRHDDLFGELASSRLLQPLRRPRAEASGEIDVEACIPRIFENAGFFEPVFRRRLIAPEYLVLIDRRGANDHIAHCGEAVVRALRTANIYVDLYWFNRDPRRLVRALDAPSLSLEEVAGRHGEHRLILIASGERLIDWSSGAIEPWAAVLRQFPRRVMMTPVTTELWGHREQTIFDTLSVPVIPLSARAIPEMVALLSADEPPRPPRPTASPGAESGSGIVLADLLEERPVRWTAGRAPSRPEQEELVCALQAGLPLLQWRWLSTCAVYPELLWNLTLHFGTLLRPHAQDRRPIFDQVVALGRLPWFRVGVLPLWLRKWLTQVMSDDEYKRVVAGLSDLFQATITPERSSTPVAVGDDRHLARAASGRVRDEVLVDFLARPPSQRTSIPLRDEIAARFGREPSMTWWKPLFSGQQSRDIMAEAVLVGRMLADAGAATAEVRLPEAGDKGAPDCRTVERLKTGSGDALTGEGLLLYLPPGRRTGHVVSDWVFRSYRRNRRAAFRLGIANLVLVLLSLLVFYRAQYSPDTNVGLHLFLAMGWIAVPFLALFVFMVFPTSRLLRQFPQVRPGEPAPRHLCRTYAFI